tara:strand:+ start:447 stop:623 length:177 start_codon:yes stop_codon:yes gene_type:complete
MSEETVFESLLENMEQSFFLLEELNDSALRVYVEQALRDVYNNIQLELGALPRDLPYV